MKTINENNLSYIPMYKSYIDAVSKLTPEDRLVIYEAIFEYGFTGIEPTFDNPYLEMGWNLVKPNLDNNISRVKTNQDNGKKGGRPKKADITIQPKINLDTPKECSNEVELKSEVIVPKEVKEVITNKREMIAEIEVEEEVDTTPSFSTKNFLKAKLINYVKERELLEANEEQLINYIQDERLTSLAEINETIDNMYNKGK